MIWTEQPRGQWVSPMVAAALVARPVATVRDWAKDGRVMVACDLASRKIVVYAPSVAARALAAQRRYAARRFRRAA